MTTQAQRAAEKRRLAGLPAFTCPNCGALAAHWIPDSLTGPGYYTCTPTESSAA
jgi:hypothetical protein